MLSFSEDNRTMTFLSWVSKCAGGKTSETKSQKCHENNSKRGLVCKTIHSFVLNWFIIQPGCNVKKQGEQKEVIQF